MTTTIGKAVTLVTLGVLLVGARAVPAQPAANAPGCCCLGQAGSFACAEKTQAECNAIQPAAPMFAKVADWKEAVAASKAAEAKPMRGGWIAESCEQAEARIGCCCFPKLKPTESDRFDCKPGMSEFDCKAECSLLKDGRLPSGCTWTLGACQR
jgi:hypothetical protein